jgi:hypothetical protein
MQSRGTTITEKPTRTTQNVTENGVLTKWLRKRRRTREGGQDEKRAMVPRRHSPQNLRPLDTVFPVKRLNATTLKPKHDYLRKLRKMT